MTEPQRTTQPPEVGSGAPAGRRGARLHQPVRAVVAGVEVLLAVLLVLAAVWCWRQGIVRYEFPFDGAAPLVATRYFGNWLATAIGLVTVAAVLVLDALRQLLLALRGSAG